MKSKNINIDDLKEKLDYLYSYWLRNVSGNNNFCFILLSGMASAWKSSDTIGIRPAFAIC